MKFVHPEALLAQLYIAVHLVHVGIYGLHQIAVNLRRHVVRIDCRFQRGRIISRLRIENLLLYLSVVKSGNRSGKLFVDAVKSFKRILSYAAVADSSNGTKLPWERRTFSPFSSSISG